MKLNTCPLSSSSSSSVTSSPLVKPIIRSRTINTPDNGQLFTFPDESPLIRLYLDVVRDTVYGLTLQTQEQSVDTNIEQRIVGED